MNDPSARRMGILFVNGPTMPPLGADTWIHTQIIRHVDRTRFEPIAACVTGTQDSPTPCYEAIRAVTNLDVVPIDFGPELYAARDRSRLRTIVDTLPVLPSFVRLARVVRRRRVAIIHTSDRPRDAALCVLLAKITRTRCIVHVHVGYGEWMSRILKWSLRRADALVAVSSFVAQTLVDSGHRPERIHVVLNAIDTGRWNPGTGRDEIRREFGIGADAPVVLTVCRLFEAKGARQLIEALPAIRAHHPDVRLLIVGSEMQHGFKKELEDLARDLGLGDNVTFTGQRRDVPELMAAADVYAMPSQWEPFGLVFAEAMAMRLPVIALDNGGTPEVVTHGVTGLLSPLGDQQALASNLCTLLCDPERRAAMGDRGRARVVDHFPLTRMARDIEHVYTALAAPRSAYRPEARKR
jgi:glycosyltransferase involved in cell wall biosynthesis